MCLDGMIFGWNEFAIADEVILSPPADGFPGKANEPDQTRQRIPEWNQTLLFPNATLPKTH